MGGREGRGLWVVCRSDMSVWIAVASANSGKATVQELSVCLTGSSCASAAVRCEVGTTAAVLPPAPPLLSKLTPCRWVRHDS